jgi:hypothetical protein
MSRNASSRHHVGISPFPAAVPTVLAVALCACSAVERAGEVPATREVGLRYWRGPVDGSLQTGQGGSPGTSSPGRPTLEEIGVDHGDDFGAEAMFAWGHHELGMDASLMLLFGEATLDEDLISHGEAFPAGTAVESSTWFAHGSVAYRYRFDLALGASDRLAVRPGAGVTGILFDYALEGDNGAEAERSYTHAAPHLELGLEWRPSTDASWWLSADVRQTLYGLLGGPNKTHLFQGLIGAHRELSRHWSVQLEAGYHHLGFEDSQTLPNHIELDFGPFLGAGVSGRW